MKISILALVAALLALVAAGCGKNDATGSAGGSTLGKADQGSQTKARFVKEAEAVCRESKRTRYFAAKKYRNVHAKELDNMSPIPREERVIRAIGLPAIQQEAKELAALEPPPGDEKKVVAIIAGIEAGLKKAWKKPYSISLEVPSEYPFREVGSKIRAYGLVECRNVG